MFGGGFGHEGDRCTFLARAISNVEGVRMVDLQRRLPETP